MPGNLKEVRIRIKSVGNTQQITKAMKMVSAAKLRRAQDRIVQLRPYSNKQRELMQNLLSSGSGGDGSDFGKKREVKNVLIVCITSDRGLCGGFNANLIKLAKKVINENYAAQKAAGNVTVMPIGKKANDAFRRSSFTILDQYVNLFQQFSFEQTAAAAEWIMQAYTDKKYDAVECIYSQFKNAATQIFTAENYLPVLPPATTGSGKPKKHDFIFEPDQATIVSELVPKILKTQLYKMLADNLASEHGARMTAMDKASENANELLKALRISYNRARQAAITTELTEIVSGANALEAG